MSAAHALRVPEVTPDDDTLGAALKYADAGWYVLPVDPRTKNAGSRVGKGWPAKSSREPEQIVAWFAGSSDALALHLGRSGAVGFDVDDPARVPEVMTAAFTRDRPPYQSSRTDVPGRGSLLYAIPPGRSFGNAVGQLGKGWGEVRGRNGVVVVAPSEHVKADVGGRYAWQRVGALPMLPPELAELLPDAMSADDAATDAEVEAFLDEHACDEHPELLRAVLARYRTKVGAGESRHPTAIGSLVWALKEARAGLYPARRAHDELEAAFLDSLTRPCGKDPARKPTPGEWSGIVAWDVAQARASDLDEVRRQADAHLASRLAPTYEPPPTVAVAAITLDAAHTVYARWLGDTFDLLALDVVLAAAAVEQLDGDPVWLLVVSGSGNAKTETVQSLAGAGAFVTSTIASEGALLSATARRERTKDATGGLLRKLGSRGLLVIKDFTTILSMNRDVRAAVLAALREVYDGRWERNVGTEGGRSLLWEGRIVLVGAVTSAYDQAHGVIATMGDRFALVRVDSNEGRMEAGRQALRNVGAEVSMRAELADAARDVLAGLDAARAILDEADRELLLHAANLVTLARTAVEKDYRGDVVEAHQPEAPTRFAKMLGQLLRGALALGADHDRAVAVALRVAGDSVPPLRLLVLADLLTAKDSRTAEVVARVQRPRSTVDRALQELHALGLVVRDDYADGDRTVWRYRLSATVDADILAGLVTRNVITPGYWDRREGREADDARHVASDISGYALPRRAG